MTLFLKRHVENTWGKIYPMVPLRLHSDDAIEGSIVGTDTGF